MSNNYKTIMGIMISMTIILFGPAILKTYLSQNNGTTSIDNTINNNVHNDAHISHNISHNITQQHTDSVNQYNDFNNSKKNTTNHDTNNNYNKQNNISNKNIQLENEYVKVKINNNMIAQCISKKHLTQDKKNGYDILQQSPIINTFQSSNNTILPTINSSWKITEQSKNTATISHLSIDNIEYKIKYTLDKFYGIQINKEIINHSDRTINISANNTMHYTSKNTLTTCKENVLSDHDKATTIYNTNWGGKHTLYWLNIFYTQPNNTNSASNSASNQSLTSIQIHDNKINTINNITQINPTQKHSNAINILLAPKSLPILEKYSPQLPLIDRTIEFGWLYIITKPMLLILMWIYDLTYDYGISIILLTLILQISMLYFNYRGHISMQKIKLIQPQLDKINTQYANDAMTKSNKTFELYNKENISIFSQILPMIIQLPIFYSIFKVIGFSIELRGAESLNIIQDLTATDSSNILFFLPLPISLGILPVLTGISFFLQNLSNPQTQTNNMEFMQYLPIIITIVAQTTFPTGLMLYLITNNLLTALRQFIMSKYIIITLK